MSCTYLSEYDKIACSAVYGYKSEEDYAKAVSSLGKMRWCCSALCYVMLYDDVMLYYIMLYHVMLCYVMLCYVMS